MSYFKQIDFDEVMEQEEKANKEEEIFPTKKELEGLFRVISKEIEDFQTGKSKFSRQAISLQMRTGPAPVIKLSNQFQQFPSKKIWELFLNLVAQDMNTRVRDYFLQEFNKLVEEKNERRTNT